MKIKHLFMAGLLLALIAVSVQQPSAATLSYGPYYVGVVAQSQATSGASFISFSGGPSTTCPSNRFYISFEDKEIFAKALSAQLNGQAVTIFYDDAAPSVVIPPHGSTNCKVLSMY